MSAPGPVLRFPTPRPEHVEAARAMVRQQRPRDVLPNMPFSRDDFWKKVVACHCSTRQRVGPGTAVYAFLHLEPFPLNLQACEGASNLQSFAQEIIHGHGLRFWRTIGSRLERNMEWLKKSGRHIKSGWGIVEDQFNILANIANAFPVDATGWNPWTSASRRIVAERKAIDLTIGRNGNLFGYGDKMIRNLWKDLKVMHYEMPIDIRMTKWVNHLPMTFGIDYKILTKDYYEAKLSQIQAVCQAARVLPRRFDDAVFAAAENVDDNDGMWPCCPHRRR